MLRTGAPWRDLPSSFGKWSTVYLLTGGEVADVTQARRLLLGLRGRAVVGDRAYDSNAFLATVDEAGPGGGLPSRANRKVRRVLDSKTFARRNIIERFFGRAKAFRRVATRYDNTAVSYAALLVLASSVLELSRWTP